MSCVKLLLILSLALIICIPASAGQIHIDTSNDNSIQTAIDSAAPGDKIFVDSGIYYESIVIDKPLSLIGNGSLETIIDGQGQGNVVLIESSNVTISGFMIKNSGESDSGIFISGEYGSVLDSCTIENNNLTENGIGIELQYSNYNIISNNSFLNNPTGISLISSNHNKLINNTMLNIRIPKSCSSGDLAGILLNSASNNTLKQNDISWYWNGINIWPKSYLNYVYNNSLHDNWCGILSESSGVVTIFNNSIINNGEVGIEASVYDVIQCNNISSNGEYGIYLYCTESVKIQNNQLAANGEHGIYIVSSISCNITGNLLTDNDVWIEGSLVYWNTHQIDDSNTVNGKPVYYWVNKNAGTVPTDAGQIILVNCQSVIIENQNMSGMGAGITLCFSVRNILRNNVCNNNIHGIYLYSSESNDIHDNILSSNYRGILLYKSDSNKVYNNLFSFNDWAIYFDISNENTVSNNTYEENENLIFDEGNNEWDKPKQIDYLIPIIVILLSGSIFALYYYRKKKPKNPKAPTEPASPS